MSDRSAVLIGMMLGFMIGWSWSIFLDIGHRRPCQMHLPNVTTSQPTGAWIVERVGVPGDCCLRVMRRDEP